MINPTHSLILMTMLHINVVIADTFEVITVVNEDGRTALQYTNGRWSGGAIALPAGAYDDRFEYFFPAQHKLIRNTHPNFDTVEYRGNTVSTLANIKLDSQSQDSSLRIDEYGIFHFQSGIHEYPPNSGGKGYWSPNRWTSLVYAFKLPKNFEFHHTQSSQPGKWIMKSNTATYYGSNVNHVAFNISFKPKLQELFNDIQEKLAHERSTSVDYVDDSVRIIMGATVLFDSGRAAITPEGKRILRRFTDSIDDSLNIIISGHTDSDQIAGDLAQHYPSNWELSAVRSLAVLRTLIDLGAPQKRMHIRAFGPFQPRASNQTEQGKAQNRRIEIHLTENH